MADQQKTHQELTIEIAALKERIRELEVREEKHELAEKALEEQSELLRTISGNMSDLLALTDIQGTILFIGGDHSVLGHPHDTILATNVMDLVHPDDRSRVEAGFSAFLTGEGKWTFEYRCRTLDGSYVWLETVGDAVRHRDGSIKTLIFNSRDITERRRAEEALEASRLEYRELAEDAPIGILRCDREGTLTYVNQRALEIVGSPDIEKTMKLNLLTFPLLMKSGFSDMLEACLRTDSADIAELPYVSHWGKNVWLRVHIKPQGEGPAAAGAQIIIDDITH